MGGSAPTSSSSQTTTYSNSFNKSYSLSNVGNISFGDAALNALANQNDSLSKLLPWALGFAALLILASFFRGGK